MARSVRLPYFRSSPTLPSQASKSPGTKGALRPLYRGRIMAWLMWPWFVLALLHWTWCWSFEQSRELPLLRAFVWIATMANVVISDKYHNSDLAPKPSAELELYWLRLDFCGIAAVLASTFALWSAHFGWHGVLFPLAILTNVCAAAVAALAFSALSTTFGETAVKAVMFVQFIPCFGHMVFDALRSSDCGVYTLIWFTYLPGVVVYILQIPSDGPLYGAHDLFHVSVILGHLASAAFDAWNLTGAGCNCLNASSEWASCSSSGVS